jgi:hypothetical protein
LAVYLSTSDEAIPIILSQPDKAHLVIPLIGVKLIVAIIVGYGVDLIFRKENFDILAHLKAIKEGNDNKSHSHETVLDETACCGHSSMSESKKFDIKEIIWHPIIHTSKVFIFIFLVTLGINFVIFQMGETAFSHIFNNNMVLQPFLTALVGLIPNCAASVAITELYLKNVIGFGSAVSGLLASGGLGLLVLYREEKIRKIFIKVIAILYGVSVISGLLIQLLN